MKKITTSAACAIFGFIFAGSSTANGAIILNPSFEVGGPLTPPGPDFSGVSIADWNTDISASGIWGIHQNSATLAKLILPPDGNAVGVIYRRGSATSVTTGNFAILYQSVDLTDVLSISFDAALDQARDSVRQGAWTGSLEAQFVIDGNPYWSRSQVGSYFDQIIDTSSLTGVHEIGFRLVVVSDVSELTGSDWFVFDNLSTISVPEPSAVMVLIFSGALMLLNRRRSTNIAGQRRA